MVKEVLALEVAQPESLNWLFVILSIIVIGVLLSLYPKIGGLALIVVVLLMLLIAGKKGALG